MNTAHAVAGIDPHKHTATAAIVDVLGVLVTSLSFPVTKSGIGALTALLTATGLTSDRIGIEGSGGLGRPVMLALAAAGHDVREVQANRTAERRKRRRRAKTDINDAEAIARETLAHPDLPPAGKHATPPPAADELAVVRDWRESLVLQRVRLLTEAEAVLVSLPLQLREQLSRGVGQSAARWHLMSVLSESELAARRLGLARQSVQRVANDLVRDGHLWVRPDPADRRAPLLALTGSGQVLVEELFARSREQRVAALARAGLGIADLGQAGETIGALAAALEPPAKDAPGTDRRPARGKGSETVLSDR